MNMNEDFINLLISSLRELGVYFKRMPDFIETSWKNDKSENISIILFPIKNWLTFSLELEHVMEKKFDRDLNRWNLDSLGLKCVRNKEDRVFLLYHLPFHGVRPENLKAIFQEFLKNC